MIIILDGIQDSTGLVSHGSRISEQALSSAPRHLSPESANFCSTQDEGGHHHHRLAASGS